MHVHIPAVISSSDESSSSVSSSSELSTFTQSSISSATSCLKKRIWLVGWFMVFYANSTIFQLYRGGQFYWWTKTTDLSQVPNKLDHIMKRIWYIVIKCHVITIINHVIMFYISCHLCIPQFSSMLITFNEYLIVLNIAQINICTLYTHKSIYVPYTHTNTILTENLTITFGKKMMNNLMCTSVNTLTAIIWKKD